MNAIEIYNLTKKYNGFTLDNLSLNIPSGCIVGLIGENGAGKTTLIKSLLRIVRPDSGSVRLLGQEMSSALKNDIGVVLDDIGLPERFDIRMVALVMKNVYKNWDRAVFADYIRRFNLPEKKKFGDFSKGMRMKLGIAIALSHHASLLILDEPTSGLDPLVRDEILDILNDFTRDETHSILISSHIVSDLEKICDYIAFLHEGHLILCEEKDRLLEQYCFIHLTEQQISELEDSAIKGCKRSAYGVEAVADRAKIPMGFETKPITIEDLFIFMAKDNRKEYAV